MSSSAASAPRSARAGLTPAAVRVPGRLLPAAPTVTGRAAAERSDALVARVGHDLVVIGPGVPVGPADDAAVLGLAPLAVGQLTARHPQPVTQSRGAL